MQTVRVIVSGFGRVGRTFTELLSSKRQFLNNRYGLNVQITAIVDIDGAAINELGFPQDELQSMLPPRAEPSSWKKWGGGETNTLRLCQENIADVLIETTPTNIDTGEPGLSHIRTALENGMHVITATKGPLVVDYLGIKDLAIRNKVGLKFSAATAAALPAYDVGAYCLAGAEISKIEGILNGTTNFILTHMSEREQSFSESLRDAQLLGIAEPDPTLDIDGWDSANKLLLLINTLFDENLHLNDIEVSGIAQVSLHEIATAKKDGNVLKLIADATMKDNRVLAGVSVKKLPHEHPLSGVNYAEKAITFTTDTMDRITVVGGKSNPTGAAAALLKDLINLFGGLYEK